MLHNKKGQEISPGGFMMGIFGGISAFLMAGLMGTGIIGKIFIGLITAVACYFLSSAILRQ